jgi:hypothetical protein
VPDPCRSRGRLHRRRRDPDRADRLDPGAGAHGVDLRLPRHNADRWFPEWEAIFDLEAPLRHQRYVNTGIVAFSPGSHPSLLPRWEECCDRIRECAGTPGDRDHRAINTRDDATGLLMWVLTFLSDDPACARRLRNTDDPDALADRVVSETLRLAQSEYLWRRASRDIEFRGVVIPAGWLVRVSLRELHRDPAHFEHPDEFDSGSLRRRTLRPQLVLAVRHGPTRLSRRTVHPHHGPHLRDRARTRLRLRDRARRTGGDEHRTPLGAQLTLARCPRVWSTSPSTAGASRVHCGPLLGL